MTTPRRTPRRAGARAPLLVLALMLALPGAATAQERPRSEAERAELEARVRARFAEIVKRRLGLSDEQERTVAGVVASFQDERRALGERQRDLRRRLRALDVDDRPGDVDDAEARTILQEMVAVRTEEVRLVRSEQEALLRVLTPVQVLQFLDLREDMADRIRRYRRGGDDDDDDRRRRRGPGGPPPPLG